MADRVITVGASGCDYTTPALAIAGVSEDFSSTDNLIFRINSGTYGIFAISGYLTTSAHRVIFECASDSYHNMLRSEGVIISNGNGYTVQESGLAYVTFSGIAFTTTANDIPAGLKINSNYCIIDKCIAYDTVGTGNNGYGFFANWQSQYPTFINCVAVNCGSVGFGLEDDGYGRAYYCTSLNNAEGFRTSDYRIHYLKNCYAGGNSSYDYYTYNDTQFTNCRSSDGSESTSIVSLANCDFNSYAEGSEDVEIGSSSQLNVGADLSADSYYPVTVDAYGNTRATTSPYIGASEYVSSVNYIPAIINNYRQQGVM